MRVSRFCVHEHMPPCSGGTGRNALSRCGRRWRRIPRSGDDRGWGLETVKDEASGLLVQQEADAQLAGVLLSLRQSLARTRVMDWAGRWHAQETPGTSHFAQRVVGVYREVSSTPRKPTNR